MELSSAQQQVTVVGRVNRAESLLDFSYILINSAALLWRPYQLSCGKIPSQTQTPFWSLLSHLLPQNGFGYCSLKSKGHVRSGIRTHASIRRPEIPQLRKVHQLESGALDRSAILT